MAAINVDVELAKKLKKDIEEELDALRNSVFLLSQHVDSDGNLLEHNPTGGENVQTILQNVDHQNQNMSDLLKRSYAILESLIKYLTEQLKKWQAQFQLFYARLADSPDLKSIAQRCGETGQILHQLLAKDFEGWKEILTTFEVPQFKQDYETHLSAYQKLWAVFLQRTFVVTEQEEFCIRKMKKHFPAFCIRALAADYMHDSVGEVTPYLVSEVNLRQCVDSNGLKFEELARKQIRVKNVLASKKRNSPEKFEIASRKETNRMECVCKNLTFEETFKRQQNKEVKVHEEKFRVVFITQLESQTIWTMSLPLVVITASNQEVNSLASIMWQCFSTNVFSIHEMTPTELKWSLVAEMLKMKFSMISKSHNLTDNNIKHLKRQLFGDQNKPDDELVSLSQFCCDPTGRKMKDYSLDGEKKDKKDKYPKHVPYSFWKWFLGVFNVIEEFLLKYWNDGLIMGFEHRQIVHRMLSKCKESGTFILRFSDTEIRDRDGVKNVYGRLKASVFCIKFSKSREAAKRNSVGQPDFSTEKVVEDLDLSDPPEYLANILKDEKKLLYCFLYPGGKSRQELFDKYYKNKGKQEINGDDFGYKKPSDVELSVPDLEKAVRQINLIAGAPSQADTETNSPGSRVVKKARRKHENNNFGQSLDSPSNMSEDSECPYDSERKEYTSQISGNSSISPSYMEQSPEQSVPNFSFSPSHGNDVNGDSVVPYSPESYLMKSSAEDAFASGAKNAALYYHEDQASKAGIASYQGINQSVNDFNLSMGGASTPERLDPQLTGFDLLLTGSGTDVRSNENTNVLEHESEWNEFQTTQLLESNSTLQLSTMKDLRETLTPQRYRSVLLWSQNGCESAPTNPNQITFSEESTNYPTNNNEEDFMSGNSLEDLGFDLEQNMSHEDQIPDLQDIEDLLSLESDVLNM
ncbi:signal transducer and activator of transcription 5A-like isoform X2 [Ruditapes philippinarum]|uniref:signal transducer and activator of transcription 5A-like isoform X2 n=1 Tax=Ruditapes philippinarum TaxID=129788 RepID=UPI00295B8F48|nr:signal transducer and activator of transcription 5A-like isoform X2 [Ruditapes philippinarum]